MGTIRNGIRGLSIGMGIAAMHYIGMEATRLPAMCHYSPGLVTLSVILAIAIAGGALVDIPFAGRDCSHRRAQAR
jgi:NO-binding membrane sensor protein with MHYT domain